MIARIVLALAAATAGILASVIQEAVEKREPPMIFSLEIDGKKIPIELDKPIDLETKGPGAKVTLRAEPHRVFSFGGLRFHYPRDMGFEADLGTEGLKLWTLDGNAVVIMVQYYKERQDYEDLRKEYTDNMVKSVGRRNVKVESSTLTLQKKTLTGSTLRLNMAGTKLAQSVYSFQVGDDSVVLVLQDSLTDDGAITEEFARSLKLMQETFQFPKDVK